MQFATPTASTRARGRRTPGTLLAHLPLGDRRPTMPPDLDPGLPVLLVRLGRYPIHHGTVGVIRTLGRAGVPVYAVTEEGITPASTSRFLTGQVKLSSGGELDQSALLDRLVEVIDGLPARPMLVCTDDEAAVLVAEGAAALSGRAIFPAVSPRTAAPARQQTWTLRDLPALRRADACHVVCKNRGRFGGSLGAHDAPGCRQAGRFVEPVDPPGRHWQHSAAHCRGRGKIACCVRPSAGGL